MNNPFRRRRALEHLADDLRDHIERETSENLARGMTPEAARAAARRKFGNATRVLENTRAVWTWLWLEQLAQDFRYGLRRLRRKHGFALAVILTLALGIGMNTVVFSVVNSVLLRPLGFSHPERLMWLGEYDPNIKRTLVGISAALEWRTRAQSFRNLATFTYQPATLATSREAFRVSGVAIAGDFWALAAARPALGRLFAPGKQQVVVLSWDTFQHQFGGDPRVVGSSVQLDGRTATLTGVLSKGFRFQFPMWWVANNPGPVEAYFPAPPIGSLRGLAGQAAAELKPGVAPAQAQAELRTLQAHLLRQAGLPSDTAMNLRVEPLSETLVGAARPGLLILLAASTFVLLMACVNVANLLMARATAGRRETAVRAALGAGRGRLIRLELAESALLGLAGGVVGLVLARVALAILLRLAPYAIPRLVETTLDGRVLAFTLAVSLGSAFLLRAGAAVIPGRGNLRDALQDGGRTSPGLLGMRLRRLLVAVELALAMVLLAGAGLMMKSFRQMSAHPPGFAPERVVVLRALLSGHQYDPPAARESYWREMLLAVESLPGVEAAGTSNWILFGDTPAFPADHNPAARHVIRWNVASPGYLRAMGMRLVSGRWLTDNDNARSILMTESLARQAFGDADPVGRSLSIPGPATVVGVVGDLKYSKLDAEPVPEIFVNRPPGSFPAFRGVQVAVRTTGDASALESAISKRISALDPTQPVYGVETLEQALSDSIAPRRFNLVLLGTFASAALLLALVGIYGVIAYSVAERTREIGVRMALGAQRGQVVGMVVREGMLTALAGVAAGLAAAWGLTRLMASLLYGVTPTDPATFAAVAVTLAVTVLFASSAPALRAAGIDPVVALRDE